MANGRTTAPWIRGRRDCSGGKIRHDTPFRLNPDQGRGDLRARCFGGSGEAGRSSRSVADGARAQGRRPGNCGPCPSEARCFAATGKDLELVFVIGRVVRGNTPSLAMAWECPCQAISSAASTEAGPWLSATSMGAMTRAKLITHARPARERLRPARLLLACILSSCPMSPWRSCLIPPGGLFSVACQKRTGTQPIRIS
jgi:hypothetical protein